MQELILERCYRGERNMKNDHQTGKKMILFFFCSKNVCAFSMLVEERVMELKEILVLDLTCTWSIMMLRI